MKVVDIKDTFKFINPNQFWFLVVFSLLFVSSCSHVVCYEQQYWWVTLISDSWLALPSLNTDPPPHNWCSVPDLTYPSLAAFSPHTGQTGKVSTGLLEDSHYFLYSFLQLVIRVLPTLDNVDIVDTAETVDITETVDTVETADTADTELFCVGGRNWSVFWQV